MPGHSGAIKVRPHVPVIQCPEKVSVGKPFPVKVSLEKETIQPDKTEPYVRWISVYFYPSHEKFSYEIEHLEFSSCEEFTAAAGNAPVYANHEVSGSLKVDKPGVGVIYATAYCARHGLRQSAKEIKIT